MASFHEVRLPVDIEVGAVGGPQFNTTILELYSGYEQRNINWEKVRGRWDLSYAVRGMDDMDDLIAFFYARQGRAYGFRFKDWTDYEIASIQAIGTGDGSTTAFQAYKRYSSGGHYYDRTLSKLVSGTVTVYEDGVPSAPQPTVNVNTGVITFAAAPALGVVVGLVCEFDLPVRFDMDHLQVRAIGIELESLPQIDIVEIRV